MLIVKARDVADADGGSEGVDLRAPAIVQDIHAKTVHRPIDIARGKNRALDDFERLVVSRDENVDAGPEIRILGQRRGPPSQRMDALEVAQEHDNEGIGLGTEQQKYETQIEGMSLRPVHAEVAVGFRDAVIGIARGAENRN